MLESAVSDADSSIPPGQPEPESPQTPLVPHSCPKVPSPVSGLKAFAKGGPNQPCGACKNQPCFVPHSKNLSVRELRAIDDAYASLEEHLSTTRRDQQHSESMSRNADSPSILSLEGDHGNSQSENDREHNAERDLAATDVPATDEGTDVPDTEEKKEEEKEEVSSSVQQQQQQQQRKEQTQRQLAAASSKAEERREERQRKGRGKAEERQRKGSAIKSNRNTP